MTKLWITTPITVHVPGKHFSPSARPFGDGMYILEGAPEVIVCPPNTPVELDSDEAERIIARWGGQKCAAPES
jgi:hypothetical protein